LRLAITRAPFPFHANRSRSDESAERLYELSKALMKRDAVKIRQEFRQFVAKAIAEKLRNDRIDVLIVSMDSKHLHVLARFPDHQPRYWIGWAKKYTTQQLKAHGLTVGLDLKIGKGIWAKRCHPEPIVDRAHQLNAFKYIRDHIKTGARIWRFDRAS
jgi:REP element-mobilizing transposase RayT